MSGQPRPPPRSRGARHHRGYDPIEGALYLFAPHAESVEVVFRDHPQGPNQWVVPMRPAGSERGLWRVRPPALGRYYRYRVHFSWGTSEVADPYATAIARRKAPGNEAWSVAGVGERAVPGSGRASARAIDPSCAVIVEVHLGDMTQHPSAGAVAPATYTGFVEDHPAASGGVGQVSRLGADAVELMPLASWPYFEGVGDADVSAVNHWGYMPSFLLAVSERFAARWASTPVGGWVGVDADGTFHDPADELGAMIATVHARGLAVVLDVVWNHVSLHDRNPILVLDPGSWIRRGPDGHATSESGCGNDLAADDAEMRRLLLAAVERWVGELGVDGLRLDLGVMLGADALAAIAHRARELRPDVWLSAEPWSLAAYRPQAVADCGYAVWNDRSRDLMRGRGLGQRGVLFGVAAGDAAAVGAVADALEGSRGFLRRPQQGVSYVESHDGATLGDRVRELGGDEVEVDAVVALATALLASTRGPVLLHAGQVQGRGRPGRVANAYNRDDAVSHIDWCALARKPGLSAWARSWLDARRRWLAPIFSHDTPRERLSGSDARLVALAGHGRAGVVVTAFNLGRDSDACLDLPAGAEIVVGGERGAAIEPLTGRLRLPPRCAAFVVCP